MSNVGDIKTFTVSGAPPGGNNLTYVWKWWDNTVDVTVVPTIQKKLNVGGVNLPVTCEYCDAFGAYSTLTTSITVNSPPVIVGAPTISSNDQRFPFNTTMTSVSYDPEAAGALVYAWFEGATPLGAGVTTLISPGTWQNSYSLVGVSANRTLTQRITDAGLGITTLDYSIRGYTATGLTGGGSSISNSIISSVNNLPEVTIGPGQQVIFTVYAIDLNPGQLSFYWELLTSDGWVSTYTTTETPAQLANGSYKSQITRSVSGETPGLKIAYCTVTNLVTGQTVRIRNTVQLNASLTPVINAITTDAAFISGAYKITRDSYVHFTGTATDRNNLLLNYRWDFSQPNGVTLWGRTVLLRPDQYSIFSQDSLTANGPQAILGQLTVFDKFNANASATIQSFVTVMVWPL